MDETTRGLLAGMAICAGGAVNAGCVATQGESRGGVARTGSVQNRHRATIKEGVAIEYDLAFPNQHFATSFAERLPLIEDYMRINDLSEEYYCSGDAISKLETKVAGLFGRQAALWCPTGTLAQGIAIRIHRTATNRSKLQMHPTSHLVLHEDGYKHARGSSANVAAMGFRRPRSESHG